MKPQKSSDGQTAPVAQDVKKVRNFESNLANTHQKFMELKLNFNADHFRNLFPNLHVANTDNKKYSNLQILTEFKIIVVENLNAANKAIRALQFESNDDMLQLDIQFDIQSDKNDSEKNRQKILMVSVGCEEKFCIIFRACKFSFKIPQILLNFLRTSGKKILMFKHNQKIINTFKQNNIDCKNILYYHTLMRSLGYNEGGGTKFEEKFLRVKLNINSETYNLSKVQKNFAALKVFILGGIVRCLKHSFTKIIKCSKCNLCLGTQFSECEKFSTNYCDLCWRGSYEKQEQKSQISENIFTRSNFEFGLLEKNFFPFLMDLNFISFSTRKKRVAQVNNKPQQNSYIESWQPSKKMIKKLQFNDIQKETYEFCSGYIVEEGEQGEQDKIIPLKNYVPQQEKQNYNQNSNQKPTNFYSQQKNTIPNNSAKKSRKQKKNPQIKSVHKIGTVQQLINQTFQIKQQQQQQNVEQGRLNQILESNNSTNQQENMLQQEGQTPTNISQPKEKNVQTKQTQQKRKKVKKLKNQFQQSFLEIVKQSLAKNKDDKVWERKATQQTPKKQLSQLKNTKIDKKSLNQFQKPQKERKPSKQFQNPQKEKKTSNQFQKPKKEKKSISQFQKPQKEKKSVGQFQKPQKEQKSPNPFQKPQKEKKSTSQFQKPKKEKKSQMKNTKKDKQNTESKNLPSNQKETTLNKKKYLLLSLKEAPLGKISTKSIFQ